jgi:hypothetical protein
MKRHSILRTIWTQDAADVALLEATLGKIMGRNADRISELFVSKRAACWTVDQRGLIAELLRAMQDKRRERSFRDRDVGVGAFDYHLYSYRISVFCRIYRITA